MKSKGLRGRTVIAVFGGSVLCAAGVVAGCDPCAWPGNADSCDPCVYMPDPPEGTAHDPGCVRGTGEWITYWGPPCMSVYDDTGSKELWKGKQLFPGFGGTIGQYCHYEWAAGRGDPPPDRIIALENAGATESCAFVEPQQADPIAIALQQNLRDAISGDRAPAYDEGIGWLARVVVLDTARPDAVLPSHGVTLANLIRDRACDNPTNCAVDVQTRQVMPWRREKLAGQWTPTPNAEAGQFGRLPDVVEAIADEINEYRVKLLEAAADPEGAAVKEVPLRRFYNASFKLGDCEGATRAAIPRPPPSPPPPFTGPWTSCTPTWQPCTTPTWRRHAQG